MSQGSSLRELHRATLLPHEQSLVTEAEPKPGLLRVGSRACCSVEKLVWQNTMTELGRIAGANSMGPGGPVTEQARAAPKQTGGPAEQKQTLAAGTPNENRTAVPQGTASFVLDSHMQPMLRICSSPDLGALSSSTDPVRLPSVTETERHDSQQSAPRGWQRPPVSERAGSETAGTVRPHRASVELLVRHRTFSELLRVRGSSVGRAGPPASSPSAGGPAHPQHCRASFSGAPRHTQQKASGQFLWDGIVLDIDRAGHGKSSAGQLLKSASRPNSGDGVGSAGQRVRQNTLAMLRREGKPAASDASTRSISPATSLERLTTPPKTRTPLGGSPRWSDGGSSGSPCLRLGLSSGPASYMTHYSAG